MGQPKQPLPDGVWPLAHRQGGVVSLGQLTDLGVTRRALRRALDDHTLWRVANGVYSTSPKATWLGYAHAGVLLAGTGAVLSGRAAGHLLGLCPAPTTIDVSAPRRVRDRGPWRFHEVQLQGRGDPPRTSPERTLLDMAKHLAPDRLLHLLADAITAGKTTAARVLDEAKRHRTFRNRGLVVEVLSDVASGVMSALERRFRDDVQRAHGLPEPDRQVELADGHITDVVHEESQVVIELDGRLGHQGARRWKDHRLDNRNTRRGWATLRYGWDDVVAKPCAVAAEIAWLFRARGWQGSPTRCPRCS